MPTPHGTRIYFKHEDESSWRSQLAKFEKILMDFGASRDAKERHQRTPRNYWATVTKGEEIPVGNVTVSTIHERAVSIAFDSVAPLKDESIQEIGFSVARPVAYPMVDSVNRTDPKVDTFGISVVYCPGFYSDEFFNNMPSRGVWRLDLQIALDPYWVQIDVEDARRYSYEEVWDYYELAKRIHREAGFTLSAGSFIENYYQFGESEGTRPGFDQLFRFDRSGPSRLILPYEERRPFLRERDANGDNELSVDRETGLFKCIVSSGPL